MKQKKQTESSILHGIRTALSMRNWLCLRVPPSIYGSKGWCDIIAVKSGITVYIECKSETGKLSKDQLHFGQQITDAGGLYIVARTVEFAVDCLSKIQLEIGRLESREGMTSYITPSKEWKLTVEGKS